VCDESIISRIFLFFFIPHVHFGPGQQFVTLMLPWNDKDDGPSADARKSK
jgi:hypothetical protein